MAAILNMLLYGADCAKCFLGSPIHHKDLKATVIDSVHSTLSIDALLPNHQSCNAYEYAAQATKSNKLVHG